MEHLECGLPRKEEQYRASTQIDREGVAFTDVVSAPAAAAAKQRDGLRSTDVFKKSPVPGPSS